MMIKKRYLLKHCKAVVLYWCFLVLALKMAKDPLVLVVVVLLRVVIAWLVVVFFCSGSIDF